MSSTQSCLRIQRRPTPDKRQYQYSFKIPNICNNHVDTKIPTDVQTICLLNNKAVTLFQRVQNIALITIFDALVEMSVNVLTDNPGSII